MRKKLCAASLLLLHLGVFTVFAQSEDSRTFGSVDNAEAETETIVDDTRGFSAQIKIETNMFQATGTKYSDASERDRRADNMVKNNYPFGGTNPFADTWVAFGYNSDWYGGKFSLSGSGGALGGIKAWVGFLDNKIKISAGNDIGYGYADSQGADAGLRVYDDHTRNQEEGVGYAAFKTVDSNRNPDNITQGDSADQGVLLEFDFDPLKIALAGGGHTADMAKNTGSVVFRNNGTEPVYGNSMQYGLNTGYKIGELAKFNAAYVISTLKDETRFEYRGAAGRVVAARPDAEVTNHRFGVYGSVYPFSNDTLGITLGWAGIFTKYLDEFEVGNTTSIPSVFKNGLNLTARYKVNDKLTIKTDHNYSFWVDKNYRIFNFFKNNTQQFQDYGLLAESNAAADVSDVTHSFLWNGIGASYYVTPVLEGSLYTRNLLRIDETEEYKMSITYFSLEAKAVFHLHPSVEAFAGITYRLTGMTVSENVARDVGEFRSGFAAKETTDTVNMIQIPIGLTIKLQP